jgi:hypothetical protein
MQLEKASSATLIAWILAGLIVLALMTTAVVFIGAGAGVFGILLGGGALVRLITAWQLDDSKEPVVIADARGLIVSRVFSTGALIPWCDIAKVEVYTLRYGLMQLPVVSHLYINLTDSSHIGGLQWFFPSSWFGRIAIPTALVKDGSAGAMQIVRASQAGLFDGGVERERRAAGTDDLLARGDIAIQRALQARGGFGNSRAQPRTMADLAYGSDAQEPPVPSRPMPQDYAEAPPVVPAFARAPQDYCEEPAIVPEAKRPPAEPAMTIQQPAPFMVNGVPYQPQRVGGFGRKRG